MSRPSSNSNISRTWISMLQSLSEFRRLYFFLREINVPEWLTDWRKVTPLSLPLRFPSPPMSPWNAFARAFHAECNFVGVAALYPLSLSLSLSPCSHCRSECEIDEATERADDDGLTMAAAAGMIPCSFQPLSRCVWAPARLMADCLKRHCNNL